MYPRNINSVPGLANTAKLLRILKTTASARRTIGRITTTLADFWTSKLWKIFTDRRLNLARTTSGNSGGGFPAKFTAPTPDLTYFHYTAPPVSPAVS